VVFKNDVMFIAHSISCSVCQKLQGCKFSMQSNLHLSRLKLHGTEIVHCSALLLSLVDRMQHKVLPIHLVLRPLSATSICA
jgi:hypothetical protein